MNKNLKIYRSKKGVSLSVLTGIFFISIGYQLLYYVYHNNFISSDPILHSIGWLLVIISLFAFYTAINLLTHPIIIVDQTGLSLNIQFSGKPFYIPWDSIKDIKNEEIRSIHSGKYEQAYLLSLVIVLNEEYSNKLPMFIKNVYRKKDNRLFFISINPSVYNVVEKIINIKKEMPTNASS